MLAYADDITLIAANRAQAAEMLKDLSKALEGINLRLLPEKCSALWTEKPEGSETEKVILGDAENTDSRGAHNSRSRGRIPKRLHALLPAQAKAGLESRARECNTFKEHLDVPCHEDKVVTGAGQAVSTLRSTNVEIDTGTDREDNFGRKKPHEVVFEDEQTNQRDGDGGREP